MYMYKTQIACIIIILFIGVLYFTSTGKKTGSSRRFVALLVCSFVQLVFDALSVYTVNHLETVSPILNRVIHIFYMGLMETLFYLAYRYLETMFEEEIGKKIRKYSYTLTPLLLAIAGTIFLPLYYVESERSNYSYGPAAFMTYAGVAVYLFLIIRLIIQYGKMIPAKKKRAIYVALLSEIPVAVYQIIIPDSLITCIGIVLMNIGIYMTTENPDTLLAEQLAREKQRADSANAAKTNFLANMSHEIRTPITAVLGMNELILRETKDKSIRHYAKDVEGAAKSLLSIINDILDISKIESGKLTVISAEYDLGTVIRDVVNMMSFKAKVKGLRFVLELDESIPAGLMGDDIRLRQILVNLLNNAVKYTHEGSVTLAISVLEADCDNTVKLHFSVKDTGIGIKEEDLKKLCEPFERIEEKRNRNIEGTGLGMSITKQLLGLLNSELIVSSEYGVGSEFCFDLTQEIVDASPIGNISDYSDTVEEHYRHAFEAPDARILLVDDTELNRKVFIGLLKPTGMQIDEAVNGLECLEKVKEHAYDIIFMDHMMPELDGVETFRIMKQMEEYPSKDAPVVILTANALIGAKEKYQKEGFSKFLEKPIDSEKLESIIRELLDESLVQEVSMQETVSRNTDEELPLIEGLDWKYASTHFKDNRSMMDTVSFFAGTLDYEAKELERLFADIDTVAGRKEYCTKVHSMKNSASTVGIIPLAGMAKVLEDAARNGDEEILRSMMPVFLDCWYSYRAKLEVLMQEKDSDLKKNADDFTEDISQLLQAINKAAEDMDIDALDTLGKELDTFCFNEDIQEKVSRIHKAIAEFDVDFLQNLKEM